MGTTITSSSCFFLSSFLFRALAVVGLVCLLVFGSLVSGVEGTRQQPTTTQWTEKRLKNEQVVGTTDKGVNHADLDFNYMSKRRVPNGPDPIHNRFV